MIKLIFVGTLSFWAFFGCTNTIITYSGPRLPKDRVAKIYGSTKNVFPSDTFCTVLIDGLKIKLASPQAWYDTGGYIEALPGVHELRVSALREGHGNMDFWPLIPIPLFPLPTSSNAYHSGPVSITFHAEVGRSYAVKGRRLNYSFLGMEPPVWEIWVEDDSHVVLGSGRTDPTSSWYGAIGDACWDDSSGEVRVESPPQKISRPNYTVGPVSSAEFADLLQNAIPSSEGKVQISGKGEWYPSKRGFERQQTDFSVGVIAVTDTSVLFLQWYEPEARFEVLMRFPYSEILSVSLAKTGFNRRISMQKKDFSFDSFAFVGGFFVDREKTEAVFALLQDRIKP